jgi:hypothetical protein
MRRSPDCGLANDLEVAYDSVLRLRITHEGGLVEAGSVGADAIDRLDDMLQVVLNPKRRADHTGMASRKTRRRIGSGSAAGVATSTFMPSSSFSSEMIAPRSKRRHLVLRVHQQIQVAALGVLAMCDRAEDPWILRAMGGYHLTDGYSVLREKFRRSHLGGFPGEEHYHTRGAINTCSGGRACRILCRNELPR